MLNFLKKLSIVENRDHRIFGLDVMRFVAIFMVLIGHSKMLLPVQYKPVFDGILLDGVAIFFVLSGFLIGKILIKQLETSEANLSGLVYFWKRRWMRTLPAYLFVLLFLMIYTIIFVPSNFPTDWWKYFLFSQNLINERNEFFAESWSLSIEEWFYLTIPLLIFAALYFFKRSVKWTVAGVAMVVLVFITIYRYQTYYKYDFHGKEKATISQLATNADSTQLEFTYHLKDLKVIDVRKELLQQADKQEWKAVKVKHQTIVISGNMDRFLSTKTEHNVMPFEGTIRVSDVNQQAKVVVQLNITDSLYDRNKLKYVNENMLLAVNKAYIPPFKKYIETHLEYQVLPRLDAILFGVIGAFLAFYFGRFWNSKWNILIALAGCYLLFFTKNNMGRSYEEYAVVWFPIFKSLSVLMILPFASNWKRGAGKYTDWVTFFSLISYSMYLVNLNIVNNVLIKNIIHGNWTGKAWNELNKFEQLYNDPNKYYPGRHIVGENWSTDYILFWVFVIGISYLMYRFIEIPFMKLRDYKKK